MRSVVLVGLLLAATPLAATEGADIVFVIDASTSMARAPRMPRRIVAMAMDLLARNAAANGVEHRAAVIRFGSRATVDVPLTPVRPGTVAGLRARVRTLPVEDRGDTDVLAALVEAEALLRAPPPDAARRQAIVLLTDGVPYVRGADMQAYRSALGRFRHDRLAAEGIALHVLLLRDGGARDEVLEEAYELVTLLIGTRVVESARSKTGATTDVLLVPPYLDVVVFDVFREAAGASVEIFPPGSPNPIRDGVNGVEAVNAGEVMSTLVVPRPAAGEWFIRKARRGARVRILSQQFFPRGVLVEPRAGESPRQNDRFSLAYRVLDANGTALQELPDFALALETTLTQPNGLAAVLPMQRDSRGRALFRATQETQCRLPGRYWTDVRITTVDAAGRRLEVFRDRWSGFSVIPANAAKKSAAESPRPRMTSRIFAWLLVPALLAAIGMAVLLRRRQTERRPPCHS